MIKALFFDLDGTLLTSSKTLLPSTVAALTACQQRNLPCYIATGRSNHLAKTLGWTPAELSLFSGGVYSNGACVVMDGRTRWALIDPEAVRSCRDLAAQHGVHLSLHMDGGGHAFNFSLPRSVWGPWGVAEDNILPLDESALQHAVKLLLFHENLVDFITPLPEGFYESLQAACGDRASLYLTDQGCTVQVAAKQVSKLTGVEQIRSALGLAEEEIAVFGDDLNDLPMLTRYPNSVAMGNAVPEALAAAAFCTRSNDDDGVAHALTKLLHCL